jgi:7TM-HD extracellular
MVREMQLDTRTALSSPSPPPKELRAKPRWKISCYRAGVRRPIVSNSSPLTPTLSPLWRGEGVETACCFCLFVVIALLSLSSLSAKELAGYKIGDRAEEDITTPAPLVIIDAEATVALKEKEGERVPVIFRFYPRALDEAMAAFHESFVKTRGDFLDAVEQNFDERKLDSTGLASDKFSQLIISFQKNNALFPVTTELARLWAGGESDQVYEAPLSASLRDEMKLFIRATNAAPAGAKVGATVRVVSYGDNETLTEQLVARHGTNHPKTDFISFQRARTDLQNTFPPEQHAAARSLGSFLRPNCFVEAELTIALRTQRAAGISATENYAAGQIIARRGQLIDQKIMATIDALKEKTAAVQLRELAARESTKPAPVREKNFWLIGGAAGALLLLGASLGLWVRRKSSVSLLPARRDSGALEPSASLAGDSDWQQRALAAESRAEKAQAVIRQGLIAHLARWMSDTLVQKLLLQRGQLIEAQQKAVTEVDKLGQRLDTIHSRMQGRLTAYERRISELEKELDTKDEINRELIQAEIQSIRSQMDAERVRGEGGLN